MYLLDNFLGNKQITVVKFDIRHVYKNINKKKNLESSIKITLNDDLL